MDKKDFKELDAVGLRDYYSKLSRSEKGRFLRYLVPNRMRFSSTWQLITRVYGGDRIFHQS